MKKNLCLASLLSSLCFGQSAVAGLWTEVGDAGGTPLTAQHLTGSGVLNTIYGNIGDPGTDTDVFRIYINDPANFSINMAGTNLSGDNDTALYVLDELGNLLFANDDIDTVNNNYLSQLSTGEFASQLPGFYLVAYNIYESFSINDDNIEFDPNHLPLLPIHIKGWHVTDESPQTGPVQLGFTGARFDAPPPTPVPAPVLLALTLAGLAGLGFSKRHTLM